MQFDLMACLGAPSAGAAIGGETGNRTTDPGEPGSDIFSALLASLASPAPVPVETGAADSDAAADQEDGESDAAVAGEPADASAETSPARAGARAAAVAADVTTAPDAMTSAAAAAPFARRVPVVGANRPAEPVVVERDASGLPLATMRPAAMPERVPVAANLARAVLGTEVAEPGMSDIRAAIATMQTQEPGPAADAGTGTSGAATGTDPDLPPETQAQSARTLPGTPSAATATKVPVETGIAVASDTSDDADAPSPAEPDAAVREGTVRAADASEETVRAAAPEAAASTGPDAVAKPADDGMTANTGTAAERPNPAPADRMTADACTAAESPNPAPADGMATIAAAPAGMPTFDAPTWTPSATTVQPQTAPVDPDQIHAQVLRQLASEPISGDGEQTMTLKLSPEHLGRVEVRLVARGDQLEVVFTAENADAETALRDGRTELAQALGNRADGRWQQVEIRVAVSADDGASGDDPDEPGEDQDTGRGERRDERGQRRERRRRQN